MVSTKELMEHIHGSDYGRMNKQGQVTIADSLLSSMIIIVVSVTSAILGGSAYIVSLFRIDIKHVVQHFFRKNHFLKFNHIMHKGHY